MLVRELSVMDTRLRNAILDIIVTRYQLPDGMNIHGQSISYLSQELRYKGWKGVSNLNDLESTCERLGFKIVNAQMVKYHDMPEHRKLCTPARVVTL